MFMNWLNALIRIIKKVVILSDDEHTRHFRVNLARQVGYVIQSGMGILGIECPKQM